MSENTRMWIRALLVVAMAVTGAVAIVSTPGLFDQPDTAHLWRMGIAGFALLLLATVEAYVRRQAPKTDRR